MSTVLASSRGRSSSFTMSRQLQSDEGAHAGLSMDEQGAFLGQSAKGLSLVSPLLGEYVSEQIAVRTSVLLERRKATEERNEQRKLPAHGGGGEGGGGAGEEGDGRSEEK